MKSGSVISSRHKRVSEEQGQKKKNYGGAKRVDIQKQQTTVRT